MGLPKHYEKECKTDLLLILYSENKVDIIILETGRESSVLKQVITGNGAGGQSSLLLCINSNKVSEGNPSIPYL